MSFDLIAEVMRNAERQAVLSGVPAAKAAEILIRAEAELTNALIASQRAERQLLLDLKEKGASQVAKEQNKSRRWVYDQRSKAINKLCNSRLSDFTAEPVY